MPDALYAQKAQQAPAASTDRAAGTGRSRVSSGAARAGLAKSSAAPYHDARTGSHLALSAAIDLVGRMSAQRALGTALSRPTAVGGGVVQRVEINGKDINAKSSRQEINSALNWDKEGEWLEPLGEKLLRQLALELASREDCSDILDQIAFQLDEDNDDGSSDEDDSSQSAKQIAFDDDEEELGPRIGGFGLSGKQDKRKELADKFGWEKFPESTGGFKKIGVHETAKDNVAKLVKGGPSKEKLGTGHGLGKGNGFYVTRVGKQKLASAVSGIVYENHFLAVYVRDSLIEERSPGEEYNHVDLMAKIAAERAIERHCNEIDDLAEEARKIIATVKEGIAVAESKLLEIKEHSEEIDQRLAEIEKLIKKLKRQMGNAQRKIDQMERHSAELINPTELYFYTMSGGGEIVIPVNSFSEVRLVSQISDFKQWPKGSGSK